VLALHRVLCDNIQPDLTILLDCDLTLSLTRARQRNLVTGAAGHADENRFERENRAFFNRVRDAFLAIAFANPGASPSSMLAAPHRNPRENSRHGRDRLQVPVI